MTKFKSALLATALVAVGVCVGVGAAHRGASPLKSPPSAMFLRLLGAGPGSSSPGGNLWNAYRSGDSYPGGMGADPAGIRDSGPAINYWITQAALTCGIVEIVPGRFRIATPLVGAGCVRVIGSGKGATFLVVDDSGGNIGDLYTITAAINAGLLGVTITALSPRTAGTAVVISGGSTTDTLTAGLNGSNFVLSVDMDSQFNGLLIQDGPSSNGAWKTYVETGSWKNFSAGGTGIDIYTVNGASHFFEKMFLYGPIATPANTIGIRIRSTGDATFVAPETWGWTHGMAITPGTPAGVGNVTAVTVLGGFIDQSTSEALLIEAQAAPSQTSYLTFEGTWFATGGFGGTANSATVRSHNSTGIIRFNGCLFYHATDWGLVIDGANNVSVTGGQAGSNTNGDIKLTGSAQSANITGVQVMSAGKPGVQIDNGCTGHVVMGINGKTSSVTDNSGAVSKVVANNL